MKKFEIGQRVMLVSTGANASDFYKENTFKNIMGVYSVENPMQYKYFEIVGDYKPITFKHDKRIFGAYPIGFNGIIIGHVYNTGLADFKI